MFGAIQRGFGLCAVLAIKLFILAWFIGWFNACIGGAAKAWNARSSPHWPHVRGTILESTIIKHDSKKGGPSYEPKVAYDYSVEAKQYEGRQIDFDGFYYDRRNEAEAILKRYPLNAEVDVYYKPGDPSQAVLEPGASSGVLAMPFIATFAGVIALIFFGPILFARTGLVVLSRYSTRPPSSTGTG